jgi:hypothetical protein
MSGKKNTRKSDKAKMMTKDYYCTYCKSAVCEFYVNGEKSKSEWIDFNG